MSLYDEIGGEQSIEAALTNFYPKILADPRVNFLFAGVDMTRLKKHAHAFLTMVFGGPNHYQGRDLRTAHRRAVGQGLGAAHFDVFMDHFRATLEELGLPSEKIAEIVKIAEGARNEVLQQ
jgi:hemoglobin